MKKIKFDHTSDSISQSLGVSEDRFNEIVDKINQYLDDNLRNYSPSEVLEIYLMFCESLGEVVLFSMKFEQTLMSQFIKPRIIDMEEDETFSSYSPIIPGTKIGEA